MSKLKPRERDAIVQALRAGVVPRLGLRHIQVGRAIEVGVHEQWSEPANVPGQFWIGFQFIDVAPQDLATIESWLGDNAD